MSHSTDGSTVPVVLSLESNITGKWRDEDREVKVRERKNLAEAKKIPLRLRCPQPPVKDNREKCKGKKKRDPQVPKEEGSTDDYIEYEETDDFCSFEAHEYGDDNEDYDKYEWNSDVACNKRILRMLQEFFDFNAARTIQRYAKGWYVRRILHKKHQAAIIIQKEWRRFYCRRHFFRMLEDRVQKALTEHYYRAAQKIQALFRGWWVRQNIHDHSRLIQIQITAGEDLLHCVAFKLHHLLRTHQIPGIFSLKHTSALSKVEELLASMSFKQCNDRIRWNQQRRRDELRRNRIEHDKSQYAVRVPFYGPNAANICEPRCLPLFTAADADHRMMKILKMFEEANRENLKLTKIKQKRASERRYLHHCMPPPTTFCGDVVRSMKKWKIVNSRNLTIRPDIFQNPDNVANFLHEIRSFWDIVHGNCLCRQKFNKELELRRFNLDRDGDYYEFVNPCNKDHLPLIDS